jgi:hypothetical protein
MAMKKILLILALALVCSFNANAQLKQLPDGTVVYPATGTNEKKASVSAEPCVTYTAEQALDATTDGNNNTFAAVYSTNATRNCGGKNVEKLPDLSDNVRPILPRTEEDFPQSMKIRPCCTEKNQNGCIICRKADM